MAVVNMTRTNPDSAGKAAWFQNRAATTDTSDIYLLPNQQVESIGAKLITTSGVTGSIAQTTAGVDGVKEVRTITVTAACSANGFVYITLNGVKFTVPVTTAANSTGAVATVLRAASYTGWVVTGTGNDLVLTATTAGARAGSYAFSGGATGAAGSFAETTAGSDAVKQVQTFTITGACLADGNVTIKLNNVDFTVFVSTLMNTTALVAAAIRATAFTGWVVTGATNAVIFTAATAGLRGGTYSFTAGATGTTATIAETTAGVNAVVEVETLTVSGAVTSNGTITVNLNGTAFSVTVTTAMSTVDLLAAAIRAATFTGWVVTGATDKAIFTAATGGAMTGTFSLVGGATGVTATGGVVQTTEGITAVAAVHTLTITAAATADGVLDVKLNDVELPYEVIAGNTINEVAAIIRAAGFTGWVASGAAAEVIFTAVVAEARGGTYSITVTGTAAIQFSFSSPALLVAGRGVFTAWDNSVAINPAVTAWRVAASAGGAAGEVSIKALVG